MSSIILYVILVVAFFALIQGFLLFSSDVREEARKSASELRLLRPTLADGVSPWLQEILLTAPVRRFDTLVQSSGIAARTERILFIMTVITVVAVIMLNVFIANPPISFAGGFVIGVGVPLLVLNRIRATRMRRLTLQLPETLETMVRSLRAGHPVPASIAMIGKEMPAPVGVEFKRVYDAMSYGLDLRDALTKMTERLHTVRELKYIVSAIKIQASTGGNLAEILSSLATLMRDQQKLKMKVKAISAEGRLSGNILAALPVGVVTLLNIINPGYYSGLKSSQNMLYVMCFAASLVVVGYLLIRRIVNIRV